LSHRLPPSPALPTGLRMQRLCGGRVMIGLGRLGWGEKLNYMHHNPVKGKWNLVHDFVLYPPSSAKFYQTGVQGVYKVTHYKDVWK